MKTMNKAERTALKRLFDRQDNPDGTYLQFRRSVYYYFLMGCWGVPYCGMFVGIESNGHTHT